MWRLAANAVDQYEEVAEAVNGGAPANSTLSYDVRGNLISDTVWTYTYDLENRMLTATASGTSCSSTCTYAYDPMGRRVSKTVGSTVTKFLRAGPAEIAEYDGSGSLLRRYVPGAGPDTFIVWTEGTGVTSSSMKWILADRQGSVAVVTDDGGKATQRFAYDPFGNETQGAPGTGFPFRYTGQRYDPETGLYYYKARYYSAKLGRFLQTDPVGCEDDFNLYAYAKNDPVGKIDPTGTTAIDEIEETLPTIPWTAPEIVITGVRDDTEKLLVLNNPRGEAAHSERKGDDRDDCPEGHGAGSICPAVPSLPGKVICKIGETVVTVAAICLELLKGKADEERERARCKKAEDTCFNECEGQLGKGGRTNQGYPYRNCWVRCMKRHDCYKGDSPVE